ncbi:NAD-dependent malic enzyme [Salinisphaera sp. USBA-960]|uniref:NAD-dependent malic enzyme n=1 Tax=Salinisphaera orenii TaxID=856731 RepID=UPI000DBE33EC|nr:NAD-dependent malic enzyme [Salifodinibacter halophilus]NNC25690.1 NAD-dependent malic enzyme [Salifodinibacter halophilus]
MADDRSAERPLYVPYAGPTLLEMPLLNKGSAFTHEERDDFNLVGLLPQNVETIEEQVDRAYRQYCQCDSDLDKHIYLRGIQDDNETMFFRLLEKHLEEMLPVIYTPTVGQACQRFSEIYRNHRGLFISYPDRERMDDMIRAATKDNVKVIVVTDGERILGLGDQGSGGMSIPIGKLALYTVCGGISPAYTLPIVLDVGTDNPDLLADPMYMGWRHKRIDEEQYNDFLDQFVQAVKRRWPSVLLQFEDFDQRHALPLLARYRDELCCFNDDIQGTAAVCVSSLLAACKAKCASITEQTIVFAGAGSAGCGIAEQVVVAMMRAGLSDADARRRIYMVDRDGLVTDDMNGLSASQRRFARPRSEILDWSHEVDDEFQQVVANVWPTVLIGVSGQGGLFSQAVVETMAEHCDDPFIMPLSNPNSNSEAAPADLLNWTGGRALIATGSPFDPVEFQGRWLPIAQCNNAYIFPSVGLGVAAARAGRVTDNMLMAAAEELAEQSPLGRSGQGALLPELGAIQSVATAVARAVAGQAQSDGVALATSSEYLDAEVRRCFWKPRYRGYRRSAF